MLCDSALDGTVVDAIFLLLPSRRPNFATSDLRKEKRFRRGLVAIFSFFLYIRCDFGLFDINRQVKAVMTGSLQQYYQFNTLLLSLIHI